jgi:hypothetical protein
MNYFFLVNRNLLKNGVAKLALTCEIQRMDFVWTVFYSPIPIYISFDFFYQI